MKKVKKEIYDAACPSEGFMAERIKHLKEERKQSKKIKSQEEKSQPAKQQSPKKSTNKKKKKWFTAEMLPLTLVLPNKLRCHTHLIFSQSDYLIRIIAINSHT